MGVGVVFSHQGQARVGKVVVVAVEAGHTVD